ncbi:MAG: YdcF family protein [Rhodospirillales bacterium]|nr:YdcF family protein [Rhodospirillales bacterium]
MFFTLSKVLWWFAEPGNALLFLLCIGVILLFSPWRQFGRRLTAFATVLAIAISTLPVGGWMITKLENRFPVAAHLPERIDGIVSLGGVVNQIVTKARGQVAVGEAVERLTALAGLAREYPEARLIFSGGSGSLFNSDIKEADVLTPFLEQIGLDAARVTFDNRARNTYENAMLVRGLANPQEGENWVLITSAFHMPRAVGSFRKVGWQMIPYPVDFHTTGDVKISLIPQFTSRLNGIGLAVHEWLGLVFYWLTDKTDDLFPAPTVS